MGRQIFVVAIRGNSLHAREDLRPQLGGSRPTTSSTRRCRTGAAGSGSSPASTASSASSTRPAGGCSAPTAPARRSATRSRWTRPAASSSSPTRRSTASTPPGPASPSSPGACRYENIGSKKPGQFDAGSGTTPTLMGKKYLSIADNADAHERRRDPAREAPAAREAAASSASSPSSARAPATPRTRSSPPDRSMIVENNYGYFPPPDATTNGKTTTPGVARVDIKRGGKGCRTVWTSQEISPSTVPKMSLATGLIYLYTKPKGLPDRWYLTAVDFRTGKTVWHRLIGTGLLTTSTTPGWSSARRASSTPASWAARSGSPTADAAAPAAVPRDRRAADDHAGRRHGDGRAQRVHGRPPRRLRHDARHLGRLPGVGVRLGGRGGGRARRLADRLRHAAAGRRRLPRLARRAEPAGGAPRRAGARGGGVRGAARRFARGC